MTDIKFKNSSDNYSVGEEIDIVRVKTLIDELKSDSSRGNSLENLAQISPAEAKYAVQALIDFYRQFKSKEQELHRQRVDAIEKYRNAERKKINDTGALLEQECNIAQEQLEQANNIAQEQQATWKALYSMLQALCIIPYEGGELKTILSVIVEELRDYKVDDSPYFKLSDSDYLDSLYRKSLIKDLAKKGKILVPYLSEILCEKNDRNSQKVCLEMLEEIGIEANDVVFSVTEIIDRLMKEQDILCKNFRYIMSTPKMVLKKSLDHPEFLKFCADVSVNLQKAIKTFLDLVNSEVKDFEEARTDLHRDIKKEIRDNFSYVFLAVKALGNISAGEKEVINFLQKFASEYKLQDFLVGFELYQNNINEAAEEVLEKIAKRTEE